MHKEWIYTFILSLAIALSMVNTVRAQNERGVRSLTKESWQKIGYWYDSSTARYHIGYPIIRSLPPLNSGMPFDIMAAYIYLDSLARFDFNRTADKRIDELRQEYNFTDPPHRFSDTLKQAAAFFYRLVDHNPILFNQYIDENSLKYRSRYYADIRSIASGTSILLYEGMTDADRRVANVALLESDYILRVRVRYVDSIPSPITPGFYFYQATADVLDTLKGHVLPPSCTQSFSVGEKGIDHRSTLSSHPCIQFMYLAHLFSDPRHGSSGGPSFYYARDPEFARKSDSLFEMRPGQEAIVFIRHNDILRDSTHDYYHLKLERRASMGVLSIVDGQVRDVNRIWSDKVLLPYGEWKNSFLKLRDRLLSGTY